MNVEDANVPEIKPPVLSVNAGSSYIKSLPDCPEGLTYIVIGPYCWGKDNNAAKAVKMARSNGGEGIYTIHRVNKEAQISTVDGGISYNSLSAGVNINIAKFKIASY